MRLIEYIFLKLKTSMFGTIKDKLHAAAHNGDIGSVKKILKNEPMLINRKDAHNWTALHYAAYFNSVECVSALLELGANHLEKADYDSLPIHLSIMRGHVECLRVFLLHKKYDKYRLLHYAAACNQIECVRLLLEYGFDKYAKNNRGETPSDMTTDATIRAMIDEYQEIPTTKGAL